MKVAERANWIHHSRIKKVQHTEEEASEKQPKEWAVEPTEDLKFLFKGKKQASSEEPDRGKERPPPDPD